MHLVPDSLLRERILARLPGDRVRLGALRKRIPWVCPGQLREVLRRLERDRAVVLERDARGLVTFVNRP